MLFEKSWQVGKVASIPVHVNFTWFIVLLPIVASLALGYLPARYPWFNPISTWAISVAATCLLFVSVLGHELAHALVARRSGIPVERISLFLFGGVAVLRREPATAWAEIKMAIAGPLSSLWLGVLLGLSYIAGSDIWPSSPPLALVEYLAIVNIALAFFNLIPAFPLDGGRLLRATLWAITDDFKQATWAAGTLAQALALLLVFWGLVRLVTGVFQGDGPAVSWIADTWIVMTGWFLGEAARAGSSGDVSQPEAAGSGSQDDEHTSDADDR